MQRGSLARRVRWARPGVALVQAAVPPAARCCARSPVLVCAELEAAWVMAFREPAPGDFRVMRRALSGARAALK
ncbi:MAG: hypothetical protein WA634_02055, partial [Silvibacterium sp.]